MRPPRPTAYELFALLTILTLAVLCGTLDTP